MVRNGESRFPSAGILGFANPFYEYDAEMYRHKMAFRSLDLLAVKDCLRIWQARICRDWNNTVVVPFSTNTEGRIDGLGMTHE